MTYLLRRGKGARRRRAHLCLHDPRTGQPDMRPLCGIDQTFNLTSNVPWGCPTRGAARAYDAFYDDGAE